MEEEYKNYPFYDWVPKPLGIIFMIILFVPMITMSGVYSANSGEMMSGLGTDNSAGNFVKIQQRVPVRIDFNNLSKEDNEHLAAGMMVVVKAERK